MITLGDGHIVFLFLFHLVMIFQIIKFVLNSFQVYKVKFSPFTTSLIYYSP